MDLVAAEKLAFSGETPAHNLAQQLLAEVLRLKHDLDSPTYQYAGARIHRHAIVCREAEIDRLRKELAEVRKDSHGTLT